jgi:hypothetical protein
MDSLRVDLEDVVLAEKVRIEPLGHTRHRIANDYRARPQPTHPARPTAAARLELRLRADGAGRGSPANGNSLLAAATFHHPA